MWPFSNRASKDDLQGRKSISVCGMRFVIKKVNPLVDFPSGKMPQIFTDYQTKRKVDPERVPAKEELDRIKADMFNFIEAGVVEPKLVKVGAGESHGREDGITVEDLFRDDEVGVKLYLEILAHSLNRFSGIRRVFFSIKIRRLLFIQWRNIMVNLRSA